MSENEEIMKLKHKISKLEIENHLLKLEEAKLISDKTPLYLSSSELYTNVSNDNYNSFIMFAIIELTNQLIKQENLLKNKNFNVTKHGSIDTNDSK